MDTSKLSLVFSFNNVCGLPSVGARDDVCQRCEKTVVPVNAKNSKGLVLFLGTLTYGIIQTIFQKRSFISHV